jgi:hypothetical protein
MSSRHSYGTFTEPSRPLNKDRLMMFPRAWAARAAHEALFPIQDMQPEEMVAGVALLFAAVASRCQLDPSELHKMGMKMLRAPTQQGGDRGTNGLIQSLQDFAGIRIMGEPDVSIA